MALDENGFVADDGQWDAQQRAMRTVECGMCDDHGYRGGTVCDHIDHTHAARRGMDKVREAMGWT